MLLYSVTSADLSIPHTSVALAAAAAVAVSSMASIEAIGKDTSLPGFWIDYSKSLLKS